MLKGGSQRVTLLTYRDSCGFGWGAGGGFVKDQGLVTVTGRRLRGRTARPCRPCPARNRGRSGLGKRPVSAQASGFRAVWEAAVADEGMRVCREPASVRGGRRRRNARGRRGSG